MSPGWVIAVGVVLLAGSAVAVIRARGAGARHDDKDQDVHDPRSARGPDEGSVRTEQTSAARAPANGHDDVDVQAVGHPLRRPVQDDELLRAAEEAVTEPVP